MIGVNPFFVDGYFTAKSKHSASSAVKAIELIREYDLKSKGVKPSSAHSGEQIKELVLYYQVSSKTDLNSDNNIIYNIFFDKDKLHNLFYKMSISYSEILDKELFI